MSGEIARAIIERKLREFRARSYRELAEWVGQVRSDRSNGPDNAEYQVETEVRWDGKTGGNIRVIVAADGPGVSAFRPLVGAFIMSADDSLLEDNPD
jgi:hypothetical protein